MTEQVTVHCQKVKQLETYLGGEIADLVDRQEGRTWKEERQFLYSEIQVGVDGVGCPSHNLYVRRARERGGGWK